VGRAALGLKTFVISATKNGSIPWILPTDTGLRGPEVQKKI
jgi:hypothetical protein